MKKLLFLLLLIVILVPIGVGMFAGKALEKGIETGGTWAFGTDTKLEGASLSVLNGSVGLDDLRIQNPSGFEATDAIRVGEFNLKTQIKSLMSDVIEVDAIEIDGPEITVEMTTSGTNLGALLDHLDKRAKSLGSGQPAADEKEGSEAPSKKLHVGRVAITNAKLHVRQSMLLSTAQTVDVPKIELNDIGGEGGQALTLPELLEKILGAIMDAAVKGGGLPPELANLFQKETALAALADVKKNLEKMGDQLKGQVEEALQKGVGDAKKQVEGEVDKLKEGLGGLLGGDDDKKKKK